MDHPSCRISLSTNKPPLPGMVLPWAYRDFHSPVLTASGQTASYLSVTSLHGEYYDPTGVP